MSTTDCLGCDQGPDHRHITAEATAAGMRAGREAAIDALMSAQDRGEFARAWIEADDQGGLLPRSFSPRDPGDYLPSAPLSGEWAGDPTPLSLAREYLTADDQGDFDPDDIDAVASAYEGAYEAAVGAAFSAYLRADLKDGRR